MVLSHTIESVGVGCPNPSGLGDLAPTMDDAPQIVPHLAPEGLNTAASPSPFAPLR